MKRLNLVQGSPEWKTHRATARNASDAPVMLGISKYKSRAQLIKERATGIMPEVDDATQRRFNDGHRFEALARPLAEEIIGEELSPVTGTDGTYSASFDGLPFDNSIPFEHKSLNNELRSVLSNPDATGADLDLMYCVQMEQQLMVCGGEKVLFMASNWDENDKLLEVLSCWYLPDAELRARIVAGWEQFDKDVAAYQPEAAAVEVVADAVIALPSLAVQIKGEVTTSNLPVFVSAADKFLSSIKTELATDQDFANAEANVKACKAAEDGIEQTKKAITAQATSIDEVMRTMDLYKEKLATVRLKLDKLVKSEKEARKLAIVTKASNEFSAHVEALESETRPIQLAVQRPDFAGAMKGLKKLSAMQEAVDTALRDGKFAADEVAKSVRSKLAWCKENAAGHSALFPDMQQLIAKPMDDFQLVITTRIEAQKKVEAEKLEAERARIQAEEEAKARAKVEEEQRAAAEAQAKIEAEAQAKVKAAAEFQQAASAKVADVAAAANAKAVLEAAAEPHKEAMQQDIGQAVNTGMGAVEVSEAGSKVIELRKPMQPTRAALVEVIARYFDVDTAKAEQWLANAFSEVTA